MAQGFRVVRDDENTIFPNHRYLFSVFFLLIWQGHRNQEKYRKANFDRS